MKISVITPCRNEARHICEFLDSVRIQQLDPEWEMEILVADGLSDDGTRDILTEYASRWKNVRIIDNPGRIVSTGLNAAIQACTGEIILRMDAHTIYAKNYVRECVNALEQSGADVVGGPWVAQGRGPTGKAIAAAFQSRLCGGKAHDPNYEGEVDTVYLGCWRREAFAKSGLFDPELVRNQDDELNFRLRRMGGRIWQSPRIRSVYCPRDSIRVLFRQYMQYGFWKVAVIRKHRALAAWRHVAPALFVCSIAAGLILAMVSMAAGMPRAASWIGAGVGAEMALYLLVCVAAALPSKSLGFPTWLLVPTAMTVYHVSYGLGFVLGVLRSGKASAPLFTALTRR